MTPTTNDFIMFYGSLQRGEFPYIDLNLGEMLKFIDVCTFKGDLRDMGAHPACVDGNSIIHGELFKITDPKVVGVLDKFERFDPNDKQGSLYLRVEVQLLSPKQTAWTYIYNQDVAGKPTIPDGHWLRHKVATKNTSVFRGFTEK